ncbi:hypothetical protein DFH09DRAFT_1074747 [Mycena vulgaris]|nr:hypothetical protein DFH09DRAFT_1074747 [Mycena vulgaris]
MPFVSQNDPGPENSGLTNGHTLLRHLQDPALEGTRQHRWMWQKKNVMPEIGWSQLCHQFTPGLEDILDVGYSKTSDRNKVLPHGVPNNMYEHPGDYDMLDFKIQVQPANIDKVQALYAPVDHEMYTEMEDPPVMCSTCWDIYLQLLGRFRALDEARDVPHDIDAEWERTLNSVLIYGPLRNGDDVMGSGGSYYMGRVNNGEGLDAEQSARLNEMIDEGEPGVEDDLDEEEEIFA